MSQSDLFDMEWLMEDEKKRQKLMLLLFQELERTG